MKNNGIGGRKRLKDEMKGFGNFVKIMKGESVPIIKRRKQTVRKEKNELLEKSLEEDIILSARIRGLEAYKTGETAMYNSKYCEVGVGDITIKGRPFKIAYIEVKIKGRSQRNSQVKAEERCKENGIDYFLVDNLQDANKILDNLQNNVII